MKSDDHVPWSPRKIISHLHALFPFFDLSETEGMFLMVQRPVKRGSLHNKWVQWPKDVSLHVSVIVHCNEFRPCCEK